MLPLLLLLLLATGSNSSMMAMIKMMMTMKIKTMMMMIMVLIYLSSVLFNTRHSFCSKAKVGNNCQPTVHDDKNGYVPCHENTAHTPQNWSCANTVREREGAGGGGGGGGGGGERERGGGREIKFFISEGN